MGYLTRGLSDIGGRRVIVALGGLYVTFAVSRVLFAIAADQPLTGVLATFILVGGPGLLILYGGYRLPQTDLHPDVYPRIVTWCLGGFGLLLGVVVLRVLDPSVTIDSPFESAALATALGSLAGLAIGMYEARAISRTHEAELYSHKLERQNEQLESFAGILAHELRNPLAIAQIYLQQAADGDNDAVEEVETAHDRIEEMIDVLLITVRGSNADIDYEPIALAELSTNVWDELSVQSEAMNADLVVETEQAIQAESVHIQHLIRHLFRNSLEHGEEGVTVRVGDLPTGFYIEDNGPGIPEDARTDVVDVGFTTKTNGFGLGLTFSVQLAETYEWQYTITDSEAGGARFEFRDVDLASPDQRQVT